MSIINDVLKKSVASAASKDFPDSALVRGGEVLVESLAAADVASRSSGVNTASLPEGYQITNPTNLLKNDPLARNFCVGYDTAWSSASGNSMQWTVPDGVSIAEFQIWGAGGNGNSCSHSLCCAFTAGGSNGEYTRVLMAVTPGETYSICAGGGEATTNNSCYSYCACNGCNSFVCSTDSLTSIMSCGGSTGYLMLCNRTAFPSSHHNYASTQAAHYTQSTFDQCTGLHFGNPTYRCDGFNTGKVCSSNRIYSADKVPSLNWGTRQCGNSICYMCTRTYVVNPDHGVELVGSGWNGYITSGCCINGNSSYRKPGLGGMGVINACYGSGPVWGSCSSSGLVIVSYK